MKKFKITKETVGTVVKIGGMTMLYGLAAMASRVSLKDVVDSIRYSGDVTYSDAINVVLESNMLSSYKEQAMKLLKKGRDSEYYKAIIKIIKSDMLSSYKIEAITTLSEEES